MSKEAQWLQSTRWALRRNRLGLAIGLLDAEFYADYWREQCAFLAARLIGRGC